MREFTADLKDRKFSEVKIVVDTDRVVVGKERLYELSKIEDVRLVEGLGYNYIEIKYQGDWRLLCEFTNKKKEEMLDLYEILKGKEVPESRKEDKRVKVTDFLGTLLSPYKWRIVGGIIASSSLVVITLIPPYLLKLLINDVFQKKNITLFPELILLLFILNVGNVFLSSLQNLLLNMNGQKIINDLRLRLYAHVLGMSSSFIDRYNTGRILSRLTTDINNTLWFVTWGIPSLVTTMGTIVGVGVALFLVLPSLGVYALIPLPVIIFGTIGYRRMSKIAYHKLWRRSADISSLITDTIPNIDSIKSYTSENFEISRLSKLSKEVVDAQLRVIKTNLKWFPLISITISTVTVLIWYIGGLSVLNGTLQLGTLVAFVTYTSMFYQPVQNLITSVIPFTQQSLTSMERIVEVLNTKSEIREIERPISIKVKGSFEFKDVSFSYEGAKKVVDNISLKINQGERIAIVGRSGSGKSTIIKLLLRFYDPSEGEILVDGFPLKHLELKSYRNQIGLIRAEPTIFYGTVEYNIRYGKTDAKPWEIIAAALASGAHEFIMELPFAYDTHLGERGNKISSGQRQMIETARLFLKRPNVIILDEATASVDSLTESIIMERIIREFKDKTIIIVAHRASTLQYVNRIIVLKEGKIVEEGTITSLVNKRGEFYSIFENQLKYFQASIEKHGEEELSSFSDYLQMLEPVKEVEFMDERRAKINGITYEVEISKPFPLSNPDLLLLKTKEGNIFTAFRPKGYEIISGYLERKYFIPKVLRIDKITTTGDEFTWYIETDRGYTKIRTRGRGSIIKIDGRLFIIDTSDDVFEINLNRLDKKSIKLIDSIV
ncbi:DUF1854 domain-containing protein [Stygiolobus caldivivus]|uniref:ABC transporter ATP-binding protein n=1 Tax=Stygiolobus caldivivus TaxID=2824673 RepID=A0A8D5U4G5_9CREN|nr:DUF1854 domain-containing protein [Stygiolobus caldivivus]BCU69093.1 ABC transporter ATP-binding protein [Stygiolobus caldivivus]